MAIDNQSLSARIIELLDKAESRSDIKNILLQEGHDERFVKDLIKETTKVYNAKRVSSGLVYVLSGALICLTSCIVTMTTTYSHASFGWMLYGLTTLGILVVFAGLMKIF